MSVDSRTHTHVLRHIIHTSAHTNTKMHTLTSAQLHLYTYSFVHALIHSPIHSVIHSLAHIFTFFNSHFLFVTITCSYRHTHTCSCTYLRSHTITCIHGLTRSCALYNLILSYIHSHARAQSHTEYMCMCKFGYACVRACM